MRWIEHKEYFSSLFRVLIACILLIEVIVLFSYIDSYQPKGFHYSVEWNWLRDQFEFLLILNFIVLGFYILGIGRYITSFLVFLLFTIVHVLIEPATSWGDTILQYVLLFMIPVDSYQRLSLAKRKEANELTENLSSFGIWMIKIHFVYLYIVNAIHKMIEADWQEGLALGFFLESVEILDRFKLSELLIENESWISIGTYMVVGIQFLLPTIIFPLPKKLKYTLILIGVSMHFGMAMILHLWQFQLIMILQYGFFLEANEIQRISQIVRKFAREKIKS